MGEVGRKRIGSRSGGEVGREMVGSRSRGEVGRVMVGSRSGVEGKLDAMGKGTTWQKWDRKWFGERKSELCCQRKLYEMG